MRNIMSTLVAVSLLGGCIVHTHDRRPPPQRVIVRENRSCPPAHHWEGGACVHNGKHHGHDKH